MKLILLNLAVLCQFFVFTQDAIYWNSPVEIGGSDDGQRPRIDLLADGTPVVMFAKYLMNNQKSVHFTKWTGSDFTTPDQLNDANILTYDWGGTEISVDSNHIYIVYKEDNVTTGRVYIHHSADGGDTWSSKIQIEEASGELAMYPNVIGYDGNKVTVTYMVHQSGGANPQYILRHSTDNGATFGTLISGSEGFGDEACYCCPSSLAQNDNYSILMFRNDASGIREMKLAYSTDGGATYDNYASVDDLGWWYASCPSSGADMILDGSVVYATYMSSGEGDENIYLVKDDLSNGDPFVADYAVEGDSADVVNHPVIDNNGDTLVLVWQQSLNGDTDIWYNFSTDEMNQWDLTSAAPVFDLPGVQNLPDVVIDDNGTIHLVYRDAATNKIMYTTGTFTSVGIGNAEPSTFSMFPNPAAGNVQLLGIDKNSQVEVMSMNGETVLTFTGQQFNTEALAAGTYLVKVNGYKHQTLVVE